MTKIKDMLLNSHNRVQIAVKLENGNWCNLRVNKNRSIESVIGYWCKMKSFRFAVLYEIDRETGRRNHQIYYFSKRTKIMTIRAQCS